MSVSMESVINIVGHCSWMAEICCGTVGSISTGCVRDLGIRGNIFYPFQKNATILEAQGKKKQKHFQSDFC